MSDLPYTAADLRAEAARQHAGLAGVPDFVGVGGQMEDQFVRYEVIDAEHGGLMPVPGTPRWGELSEGEFDAAQRAIDDLISGAVYTSEWAVNLGADGLEPAQQTLWAGPETAPTVRVMFAFAPGMTADDRDRFVGQIAAAMTTAN